MFFPDLNSFSPLHCGSQTFGFLKAFKTSRWRMSQTVFPQWENSIEIGKEVEIQQDAEGRFLLDLAST